MIDRFEIYDGCTPISIDRDEYDDIRSSFEHHFDDDICTVENSETSPFMDVVIYPTDWDSYAIGYISHEASVRDGAEMYDYKMAELPKEFGESFGMPANRFVKYLRERRDAMKTHYKRIGEKMSNEDIRWEMLKGIYEEEYEWRWGMLPTDLQDIVFTYYAEKCEEFIHQVLGY